MSTPHLAQEIIASALEIVGTFLLGVEAIKLPNLRAFREKSLGRVLRWIRPSVWVRHDPSQTEIDAAIERKSNQVYLFFALVGLGFLVLLALLNHVSPSTLWSLIRAPFPESTLATIFVVFMAIVLTSTFSLVVGFLLYKVVFLPFQMPFKVLVFIEEKTPSGGIGILGIILFFVGAVGHILIEVFA